MNGEKSFMDKLDGKVAIVTGAARGHSQAVARRFVEEGAAVAICDIVPVKVPVSYTHLTLPTIYSV